MSTDAHLLAINAAVHELADHGGLIDQLREALGEKGTPTTELVTRGVPGSRPPWDGRAADAYLTIHAWAREAEADLGSYVRGHYHRRVGGGDRATKDALGNVVIFCEDNRVPANVVLHTARHLGRLVRAAQSVPAIDTAPQAAAMLRQPCPSCQEGALLAVGAEIACANEVCAESWTKDRWPALLARLARGGL